MSPRSNARLQVVGACLWRSAARQIARERERARAELGWVYSGEGARICQVITRRRRRRRRRGGVNMP